MKKSMIMLFTIILVLSIAGTAVAANDFSDVAARHWAYDAVSQLQQAGLVDGYSDGTFRGDKALTRYEFAVVIARGLENYTKANTQQKGLLDKLSAEFAAELNNIGVRLNKLEKNQPNLKFSGNAEVRYTSQDNNGTAASSVGGAYRIRLNGVAKVDDNTNLGLRLASGTTKAGTKYKYSSATF
ncbi:MAG: S-layer y domain protein, partial [Sporomusa sp.]|nr:S-layer y domain protein [Sporomusa sp.]